MKEEEESSSQLYSFCLRSSAPSLPTHARKQQPRPSPMAFKRNVKKRTSQKKTNDLESSSPIVHLSLSILYLFPSSSCYRCCWSSSPCSLFPMYVFFLRSSACEGRGACVVEEQFFGKGETEKRERRM